MENSLKQRIVGAIVLIALAVIFLPSILKEKNHQQPFQSQIPAKPVSLTESRVSSEIESQNKSLQKELDKLTKEPQANSISEQGTLKEQPRSVRKAKVDNSKADKGATVVSEDRHSEEQPQTIGKQYKSAAWIIQVASFSNQENSVSFVGKLKKAGHKAFSRVGVNSKGRTVYRIFVGPYIEKERASKALLKIDEISASKGIILPFDPAKH